MKKARIMLTRSSRKHIRTEKAKIRRVADAALRAQKLAELYAKFGLTIPEDTHAR
jgi:hypothetical protein